MPAPTNTGILRWAARRGATNPRQIADLMHVSPGTVRTWSPSPCTEASPRILLIAAAVEAGVSAPNVRPPEQLAAVRQNAGLPSLVALAEKLGVSRQTLNF